MKSELRAKRKALESLWHQGLSGQALLAKHTHLIDTSLGEYFAKTTANTKGVSLVALGGYGRKELFPFSDIDLMILHQPGAENQLEQIAEDVLYPLWDAGLEVGHGVRTPEICLTAGEEDFFLQVALLDARLIAGSKDTFQELSSKFKTKFIDGQRKDFFEQMLSHCRLRHDRFGNHSYLLEPQIKESRGGFRDIQAMLWSANVVFGLKSLDDLENAAILSSKERHDFQLATDNLVKIRNRLHYISGRKNDQLFFEHQEEMAMAFTYLDSRGTLGVELFMRELHNHLQTIAVTVDLFFEHISDVVGLTKARESDRKIEDGIASRRGRIKITEPNLLKNRPHLLMKVFALAAKKVLPIHHQTKKLINQELELISTNQQSSKRFVNAFLEAIQAPNSLDILTVMLETGLLSAFIPEFEHLESLAQHDIYHVYTVDRHLIQTVAEINNSKTTDQQIHQTVKHPKLLCLAALLHDIGKGTNKPHAEYGAKLATTIAERFGLSNDQVTNLSFLVKYHLFLTETAIGRDIEDEDLLLRCAKIIKTADRLAMLYLLSIADAKATGPTVLSEWKAALIQELYLKIAHIIDLSDPISPDKGQAANWMRDQLRQTTAPKAIDIKKLPDDYLLAFTTKEITSHINTKITKLPTKTTVLESCDQEDHWQLLIMTNDQPGLLNRICGVLTLHNLKVIAAKVFTWQDGTVVDSLKIISAIKNQYKDQNWQKLQIDLDKALNYRLGIAHRLNKQIGNPKRKITPPKNKKSLTKVNIDQNASDKYTIIEVIAEDKAALLYNITSCLADFRISIHRALIGTKADQIVDVFYVVDHQGHKITDKDFTEEITKSLLHAAN